MRFTLLQSMFHPSSDQANRIYHLFNSFNIAAFGMFIFVTALTIYICTKYRKKSGQNNIPIQVKGNYKTEVLMILLPLLLVIFFFYQSIAVMRTIEPAVDVDAKPDVIITGHQFWWEVEYNGYEFKTANEVHLPVGKKLLMEMLSGDVIHDWWVPELGTKMDVIPGRRNYLWLTIDKPGNYAGTCSEFCGAEHAWMRMNVIAQDSADYNNWLLANSKPADIPVDTLAKKGEAFFQTATCANCHSIQGTLAQGNVGPDLTHILSRNKMLGGMMPVNEANLYKWISNPQGVKPGSYMPNFVLSKDTLNALVHYIAQLK